jgi:hypothetical protein
MPREPTLQEVIDTAIESRLLDIHTSLPGRVKKYDAAAQTVDVELVVRGVVPNADDDGAPVLEDLPIIPNVPVEWPQAGGFYFHMPLAVGDEGKLTFFEAAVGHFRESGATSPPGDLRRHSLSSATFTPCAISKGKKLPDAPTAHALIGVPAGKFLQVSTPSGTADFVALAQKVDDALSSLKDILTGTPGAQPVPPDAGEPGLIAIQTALADWPGPSVKADTLKAE